jgi:hypothetical protein
MAQTSAPCDSFALMSPYEAGAKVKPTGAHSTLSNFVGKPTVLHLYTG